MNLIVYRLNDGLVDLLFQTNSNVLKNHLIFSYAFTEFYDRYITGRVKVYVASTRLKKSSIIGFITGVIYCFFFFSRRSLLILYNYCIKLENINIE